MVHTPNSAKSAPKSVLSPVENTFEIDDPDDANIKYKFIVPGINGTIQWNMLTQRIAREIDPEGTADIRTVVGEAFILIRIMAAMELFLVSAGGALWPYGGAITPGALPKVDHTKFPDDKIETLVYLGLRFDQEVTRFRSERITARSLPPQ